MEVTATVCPPLYIFQKSTLTDKTVSKLTDSRYFLYDTLPTRYRLAFVPTARTAEDQSLNSRKCRRGERQRCVGERERLRVGEQILYSVVKRRQETEHHHRSAATPQRRVYPGGRVSWTEIKFFTLTEGHKLASRLRKTLNS